MIFNRNIVCIILLMLLISTCLFYKTKTNNENKKTILIQALCESSLLTSLIQTISQPINTIIKKELGLEETYDFDFFLPKKLLRLTLYYINDLQKNGEPTMFSALEDIEKYPYNYIAHQITVDPNVEFFGDNKDELVVIINDRKEKLVHINSRLKTQMHQANKEYMTIYRHDLYDISKSERHPYLPHIGLGRIRCQSIKQHIKDSSQVDAIFEHIRERIKELVLQIKEKFTITENEKIDFNKIGLLDMQKQIYIKEYIV